VRRRGNGKKGREEDTIHLRCHGLSRGQGRCERLARGRLVSTKQIEINIADVIKQEPCCGHDSHHQKAESMRF